MKIHHPACSFLMFLLLISFPAVVHAGSSAEILFQRAMHKQMVDGDLDEAIRLYREIVENHGSNRPVAAKALFQLGQAYEKLGKVEASRTYERLLKEYADQTEEVKKASARLAALKKPDDILPATMGARRIWAGKEVDAAVAPSPDGSFLSFVDWETGDLAVRDLRTGEARRLTNKGTWSESVDFAESSVVSPDGKRIAYGWFREDGFFELRLIPTAGGEARVLLHDETTTYVQPHSWTPDGKAILTFVERHRGTADLVLVTTEGTQRPLLELGSRYPIKAGISPDGRWLVFDQAIDEESANRDISILELATGEVHPVVTHPAVDHSPLWTPDARSIVFLSDRTGTDALWIVEMKDGRPAGEARIIKPDMSRTTPVGFSRGGNLYFALTRGLRDVQVVDLDPEQGRVIGGPRRPVERYIGRNFAPDWSLDGKYLSYSSQRGSTGGGAGSRALVIQSLESGKTRELMPRLSYFQRPRWTPDGRYVTATAAQKRKHGLYNIDVATGEAVPLVVPSEGQFLFNPTWSYDGEKLYYTRGQRGQMAKQWIAELDAKTGEERVVFAQEGMFVGDIAVSPDGSKLAFRITWRSPDGGWSSLAVVSIDLGEMRELARFEAPKAILGMSGISWTPDGESLYFVLYEGQGPNRAVWRIPAAGGKPEPLGIEAEDLSELRLHPSGRHLAFTAGRAEQEIWVLENFLPDRTERTE